MPLTAAPGGWSAPTGAGALTYNYQWEDCNQEGNDCQAIPGAQTPTYTPQASDTGHTLRALITAADEDGATPIPTPTTTLIPATASTPSAPQTTTSDTTPATNPPSTGVGAANGTPASETATLQLNSPTTVSRSYKKSALKLTGQLTNNHAQPIAGATLDILQQTENANTPTLIEHATTSATGAFTANIPRGPTRTITIGYRAYTNNSAYTTTAKANETVEAAVRLNISPWPRSRTTMCHSSCSTTPTGTIMLSGKVQGPIPPHSIIVELLVYYHGAWEPFRDPRTNNQGHFHKVYRFQDAIGHFPFRAEIPAGQAGYPYTPSYSNTITVNTTH